jgi:xanthosine utilization system XapX-like protein
VDSLSEPVKGKYMSEEIETEDLESTEGSDLKDPSRPSLVINVHSWATPIVGLLMLVVGLLAGYLVYPVISEQLAPETPVAAAPTNPPSGEAPAAANPPSQASVTQAPVNLQEVMDYLVPQIRHFRGDPEAAVTIIEFSDFQ